MSQRPWPDYNSQRFDIPKESLKWRSRYDMASEEQQNLQQQNIGPVYTEVLTVSTAQSPTNPYLLGSGTGTNNNYSSSGVAGRAFRVTGLTSATAYNFSANTGIETLASTVIVGVWVNKIGSPCEALFIKHGGVYRGDFLKLFFFWPAQANNSARITVYKFDDIPGAGGDPST